MDFPDPFIAVHDVTKNFGGVQALRGVSIDFYPGEVHCLAGENGCGKSTLMKAISGAHSPTSGWIVVNGKQYSHLTPRQAFDEGIEVIYQDFSLLPNLTAAENITLPGSIVGKQLFVSPKKQLEIAASAVERLGISLDLTTPMGELTVADRQLCAIARALAHDAKFIAMDEPTTALTWKEVEALFGAVRILKESGVALVFISHKMQEVFDISDRVSVMRNGKMISSGFPSDFTHTTLTETMTGRSAAETERVKPIDTEAPVALEVRNLGKAKKFADISFTIHEGEIVGLSGLLGSGRTEIAEALAGINPADSGEIVIHGKPITVSSISNAIEEGIAYVPEDRLTQGLFLDQPIGDNLVAASLKRLSNKGILNAKQSQQDQHTIVDNLRIKIGALKDAVSSLSGGNAQRVLLGKWLLTEPSVLILNGPTVGVDVGSKFDILSELRLQSLKGTAILIISDDVPELVATCHNVLIVKNGRLTQRIAGQQITEDSVVGAISQ